MKEDVIEILTRGRISDEQSWREKKYRSNTGCVLKWTLLWYFKQDLFQMLSRLLCLPECCFRRKIRSKFAAWQSDTSFLGTISSCLGIASPVTVPIISQRRSVTISRWGWCLTLVSLGFYYMRLFYWSSLLLSKILDCVSVHWIHVPHHHFCHPPT